MNLVEQAKKENKEEQENNAKRIIKQRLACLEEEKEVLEELKKDIETKKKYINDLEVQISNMKKMTPKEIIDTFPESNAYKFIPFEDHGAIDSKEFVNLYENYVFFKPPYKITSSTSGLLTNK